MNMRLQLAYRMARLAPETPLSEIERLFDFSYNTLCDLRPFDIAAEKFTTDTQALATLGALIEAEAGTRLRVLKARNFSEKAFKEVAEAWGLPLAHWANSGIPCLLLDASDEPVDYLRAMRVSFTRFPVNFSPFKP